MTIPIGIMSPYCSELAHLGKPGWYCSAAAIPSSPAVSVLVLFQVLLSYPCVSAGFGTFPTSAAFTWLKPRLCDRSLTREISSTVASWMLTWLSATTSGIRSVKEREAGRGELHARVEVTRLSSFKAFSFGITQCCASLEQYGISILLWNHTEPGTTKCG